MSDFVRSLVLRAAGLAPVLKPRAAAASPPVEEAQAAVEEIEAIEGPARRPVPEETEARPERVARSETRPEKARVERRDVRAKLPVEGRVSFPAKLSAKPAVEMPPELPVVGRVPSRAASERAEKNRQSAPRVERAPVGEEATMEERRLEIPPSVAEEETRPPNFAPAELVWAVRREPEARPAAHRVQTVREIEFVDRPALPLPVLEEVAAVVKDRVPEAPARIEVHIGRIEISAPQPSVPAPKAASRQPRGFAENGLERRYLRRRWY